jgi:hypothetical protein
MFETKRGECYKRCELWYYKVDFSLPQQIECFISVAAVHIACNERAIVRRVGDSAV